MSVGSAGWLKTDIYLITIKRFNKFNLLIPMITKNSTVWRYSIGLEKIRKTVKWLSSAGAVDHDRAITWL